jgi:hypothetical protein
LRATGGLLPVVNYRFYILNKHDRITGAHVAECEGDGEIEHTALTLLAEHQASAAVEVWDRDKLVHRVDRSKLAS